jgi:hypothetical protein
MSAIGRGPSTKPNGQTKKLVIKPLKRESSAMNCTCVFPCQARSSAER